MQADIVDEGSLLEEEKTLYLELVALLDEKRRDILYKVLQAEQADIPVKKEKEASDPKIQEENILQSITEDVKEFIGQDMEMHGPYNKDQEDHFPESMAHLLLNKGCAEVVE